jgi:hypothetical protein
MANEYGYEIEEVVAASVAPEKIDETFRSNSIGKFRYLSHVKRGEFWFGEYNR